MNDGSCFFVKLQCFNPMLHAMLKNGRSNREIRTLRSRNGRRSAVLKNTLEHLVRTTDFLLTECA